MKSIIFLLAIVFFVSECNADIRVLEKLKSKGKVHALSSVSKEARLKTKSHTTKHKKPKIKPRIKRRIKRRIKFNTENLATKKIKPKEIVTSEELEIRNNIAYLPNGDKAFTGKYEQHHSNGKKYIVIIYKDGKKEGPITMWDENEHKIGVINYKDGERLD